MDSSFLHPKTSQYTSSIVGADRGASCPSFFPLLRVFVMFGRCTGGGDAGAAVVGGVCGADVGGAADVGGGAAAFEAGGTVNVGGGADTACFLVRG